MEAARFRRTVPVTWSLDVLFTFLCISISLSPNMTKDDGCCREAKLDVTAKALSSPNVALSDNAALDAAGMFAKTCITALSTPSGKISSILSLFTCMVTVACVLSEMVTVCLTKGLSVSAEAPALNMQTMASLMRFSFPVSSASVARVPVGMLVSFNVMLPESPTRAGSAILSSEQDAARRRAAAAEATLSPNLRMRSDMFLIESIMSYSEAFCTIVK